MSKKDFIDNTLIRLKREYTKDEVVSALYKKLSERDIEIGGLKSHIDELEYSLNLKESKQNVYNKSRIQNEASVLLRSNEIYNELKKDFDRIKEANNQLLLKLNNNG